METSNLQEDGALKLEDQHGSEESQASEKPLHLVNVVTTRAARRKQQQAKQKADATQAQATVITWMISQWRIDP